MAMDQCHEQNNAAVKQSAGGAIGLNQSGSAKTLDSGRSRSYENGEEFESLHTSRKINGDKHHEQNPGVCGGMTPRSYACAGNSA